jgi:hypothetical protein
VPGHDLLLKLNPAGGIPLTAIYFPGRNDPVVLASVYSSKELLDAVKSAPGASAAADSQVVAR